MPSRRAAPASKTSGRYPWVWTTSGWSRAHNRAIALRSPQYSCGPTRTSRTSTPHSSKERKNSRSSSSTVVTAATCSVWPRSRCPAASACTTRSRPPITPGETTCRITMGRSLTPTPTARTAPPPRLSQHAAHQPDPLGRPDRGPLHRATQLPQVSPLAHRDPPLGGRVVEPLPLRAPHAARRGRMHPPKKQPLGNLPEGAVQGELREQHVVGIEVEPERPDALQHRSTHQA